MVITYSQQDLDNAAAFVVSNNQFIGPLKMNLKMIKDDIISCMKRVAKDPEMIYSGTLGYTVIADREEESFTVDEERVHFTILVDPSLGTDYNNFQLKQIKI